MSARAHAAHHHLDRRAGREGRLPALHAQGDPRAAASGERYPAQSPAARRQRRHPRRADAWARSADAWCILACGTSYHAGPGRQVPDREHRAHPVRGRPGERVPLPRAGGRRAAIWSSPSRKAARPSTPWPRSRRPRRAARRSLAICNVVDSAIARACRSGPLHARRSRNRRRLHQVLHRPARGADLAGHPPGPAQRRSLTRRRRPSWSPSSCTSRTR